MGDRSEESCARGRQLRVSCVLPLGPATSNLSESYDSVGKTTWEGSLEAVKRKGSVIYFGNASGPVPPINISVLAKKNTKIMRATVMQYTATRDELEHYANMLFDYLKGGKLTVNVHKIYDLKDVQQAHQDLEARLTSGKLLLKVS